MSESDGAPSKKEWLLVLLLVAIAISEKKKVGPRGTRFVAWGTHYSSPTSTTTNINFSYPTARPALETIHLHQSHHDRYSGVAFFSNTGRYEKTFLGLKIPSTYLCRSGTRSYLVVER